MNADIENVLRNQDLKELELEPFVSVIKSTSIRDTIQKMRNLSNIHAVIVVEDDKPIGVFSRVNMMHRLALSDIDLNSAIETVMLATSKSVTLSFSLMEAASILKNELLRTLPIVDEAGKVIGVVTARSLIRHIAAHFPTAVYNLPPDPHRVSSFPDGA
ncbi:MAG: CBS domain-containing protein [SAR324 cluster bacterium]|nr:CBS domain-containing protein [SAR324 cluster bacterium]